MDLSTRSVASLFFLLCATWSLSACSSSPSTPADEIPVDKPAADQLYHDASPWLPADGEFLLATSWQSFWDHQGYHVLPTALPDAPEGASGTVSGLRSDVTELLRQHLGLDPTSADAIILSVGPRGPVLVLFGDFEFHGDLEATDIDGQSAYHLSDLDHALPFGVISELTLLPIDDPHPGLVLTLQPVTMASILDDYPGDGPALPDELLESFTHPSLLLGLSPGPMAESLKADTQIPVPDHLLLGFDDEQLSLLAQDSPSNLDALASVIDDLRTQGRQWLDQQPSPPDPQLDLADQLLMTHAHHFGHSIIEQLEPQRSDHQVRYDIAFRGTTDSTVFLLGLGAALAIPAFMTYQNRAKASEAHAVLTTLSQNILDTYRMRGDFPGKPGLKIQSHGRLPASGEALLPNPQVLSGELNGSAADLFQSLGLSLDDPHYFRYTLEIHPGQSPRITLKAEHNFQPQSPHHHTTHLEIDVTDQGPRAYPMWTEHEFH